jgi:iron complex transport system permease protein
VAATSEPVVPVARRPAVALPGRAVRLGGAVSLRLQPRGVGVGAVLVLVILALVVVGLGSGEFPIAPADVVRALVGAGDPGNGFIVRELRLPRIVCGLFAGVALGLSGAIFQALTRNPLGSPDIVGFEQGASVGALIVLTILAGSGAAVALGSLAGGMATAAFVYGLAFTRGGATGYRIILVGIGMSYLMLSGVNFLLVRARIEEVQEATRWLIGSLNNRGWEDAWPLLVGLAVLLPLTLLAARSLRALELGDDSAYALGLRVERARMGLVAIAVALVSVATVAVGPITFVALTAPQIARRLTRSAGPPLVASALTGAVVVLAADVLAQRLVPGSALPAGIITGGLGGAYLTWLLAAEWRSGRR